MLNISFAPVRIYTYFDFPSVTRHTRRKLLKSKKIFAMLSMRMYTADSAIIFLFVAIADKRGFMKLKTKAEQNA